MIKKIDSLISFLNTLVTASIGVISLYFIETIKNIFGETVSILTLIILIVLLTILLEKLFISIIANSRNLRKIISGNHYIEGHWIDKTIGSNGEMITVSLFEILFKDGALVYQGETFNKYGNTVGVFRSTSTNYDNYKIFSSYSAQFLIEGYAENKLSGFAEYHFVSGQKHPTSFHGYAIDNLEGENRSIQANKIKDDYTLKHIYDEDFRKSLIFDIFNSKNN